MIGKQLTLGRLKAAGEIKFSSADWLNEVKNPNKSFENMKYCDRWWLVIADQNMVKAGELPADWGMMAVVNGQLKVIKKAPQREALPMSHDFIASLLRTDARESIPLDVHRDEMKDYKRRIEAEYKARYAGLLDFMKRLHSELGIKLENSGSADRPDDWYARIGSWELQKLVANGSWNLTPEQLAAAVKISLAGDMRKLKYEFESLNATAKKMLEISAAFESTDEAG